MLIETRGTVENIRNITRFAMPVSPEFLRTGVD